MQQGEILRMVGTRVIVVLVFLVNVLPVIVLGASDRNLSVETACPPLMVYQDGVCVCNPAFSYLLDRGFIRDVFCDQQTSTVYAASGTCVTYDSSASSSGKDEIVIGDCSYVPVRDQDYKDGFLKPLAQNSSDLDAVMCDPFNRRGTLCSSCKEGYGVGIYSFSYSCAKCTSKQLYTFLYLVIELVPITVLYVIMILFRIHATVPPLIGLVYFSHVMISVTKIQVFVHTTMLYSTTRSIRNAWQLALFFNSVWSLDFFRVWMPPFCVSETLTNTHVTLLEYVSAFYPLALVLATFIVIEMHGYNIRLVVWIWKPFHSCFVRFRNTWDIRHSIVNAFSTFLFLAYFKILSVSLTLLHQTPIYNVNGTRIYEGLHIDPTEQVFKTTTQRGISALAILIILAFSILPVLLLLFYPTRLIQKLLRCWTCRAKHAVHMFVDTYQGCLKDGSQGTRDYRPISALYFILRFLLLGLYIRDTHFSRGGVIYITFSLILIMCSILFVAFKPYKNEISNYTEFALLFFLGNIGLFLYLWLLFPHTGYASLIVTLNLLPHCAIMCYILYCIVGRYKGEMVLSWFKRLPHLFKTGDRRYKDSVSGSFKFSWLLKIANSKEDIELDEEVPDRLNNPENYHHESSSYQPYVKDKTDSIED